ncbi:histone deacetylase 11 isoform X2 [Cylas formicarius]|uniref:histone deacetylase 11 isoform X2 n=1 Tax=Cylas formicarius TaxID=197179 RepID=UPI00295891DB|nr:histone deacetylase 11 isoform X2 [Cylas formicarius]
MYSLYVNISPEQLPIIYRKEYNVKFFGLERLHPFDAGKWGNIFKMLNDRGLVTKKTVVVPNEAKKAHLLMVHKKKYLKSLKCSFTVAGIAEVAPLVLVPNYFVQKAYLRPMRYQTGGSILAGKLALDRGWAINIGGGFHHCSASKGGGFCVYADITLLIKFLFYHFPKKVQKVLIVDLDAHQGNGYEHDFKDNDDIYIMDVYNKWIYPRDVNVKGAIRKNVPLDFFTEDEEYLKLIRKSLAEVFEEFSPHLIVYNAGTDVLNGDKLGGLSISEYSSSQEFSKVSKFDSTKADAEGIQKFVQ